MPLPVVAWFAAVAELVAELVDSGHEHWVAIADSEAGIVVGSAERQPLVQLAPVGAERQRSVPVVACSAIAEGPSGPAVLECPLQLGPEHAVVASPSVASSVATHETH